MSASATRILAALFLLLAVAVARTPEDPHLDVLLEGVTEIAGPGSPGGVCAFGPGAFVVVAGRGGAPVIAATVAGEGRVMVLGHGGYLGGSAFAQADTGRFVRNSLRWLAGGKRKPLIACPGNGALARAMERLGLRTTTAHELKGVDCVVLAEAKRARRRVIELREFVLEGGGLMVAATGWGWQQLNSGKQLARDLHANRLLEPLGLAFTPGTVGETGKGGEGFVTTPRPPALSNAGEALAALRAGETDPERVRVAQARLNAALGALSDHEPLVILPLRRMLESDATLPASIEALRSAWAKRRWRPLSPRWSEWQLIGPFAHKAGDRGISQAHPPEKSLRRMALDGAGPDLTESQRGKGRRVRWTPLELPDDGRDLDVGPVRFLDALNDAGAKKGWENKAAAYLYRRVELDEDSQLDLRLGSEDGCRLWCNGELLLDRSTSRGIELDATDVTLPLKRGVNHLLVKVAHGAGPWSFRLGLGTGVGQPAIDAAIDRGVDHLLERQLLDGSWSPWPEYGVGYSALAVYTLIKSGLGTDHPAVRRGLAFVHSRRAKHTYAQSCVLLALAAAGRDEDLARLPELVEELIDWQEGPGLYAYPIYPHGQTLPPDLSNTLYAALALRAASRRGVDIPPRVWTGLIKGTLRCRETVSGRSRRTGETTPVGFSYRAGGRGATGSMTTAALSVLIISRDALGDEIERKLGTEVGSAIAGGLAWIDREMTWTANPGKKRWHYFFLYGLERVGALLKVRIIGKVTWYPSGAEYLVEHQGEDGSWRGDDSDRNAGQDTILALLFLSRATAPQTGKGQRRGGEPLAAEKPEDDLWFRAIGRNPFDVWITGFAPRAMKELGYPVSRKTPVVERVWYTARAVGEEEERALAEVLASSEGGAVQRFEARLRFEESGAFELFAHAAVRRAARAGEPAESVEFTSGALRVEVPEGAGWEALRYPQHAERNLLRSAGVRVAASTVAGAQKVPLAVDGRYDTRWRCAPRDANPWWKAALPRPRKARYVLLGHAGTRPMDRGEPQVSVVEVVVDGGPPLRLELDPDPSKKAVLELPEGTEVTQIEVRIVGTRDRTVGRQGVGFSEVELLVER